MSVEFPGKRKFRHKISKRLHDLRKLEMYMARLTEELVISMSPFRAGLHIGCCDCNPIQNAKSDVKRHQRTPDASSAQHPPKSVLQEVQCKKSLGNSSKSYPSLEIFTFASLFKGVRSSALKTSIWWHWNPLSPPSVAHCFSRNVY